MSALQRPTSSDSKSLAIAKPTARCFDGRKVFHPRLPKACKILEVAATSRILQAQPDTNLICYRARALISAYLGNH